eukprot:3941027-Rhodomonas_salina.2
MNLRVPPILRRAKKHDLRQEKRVDYDTWLPASQPMPVRGMPGPALTPPVRRASSLERAVLFKACPAMIHASTPATCSWVACSEPVAPRGPAEETFEVMILIAFCRSRSHHLVMFNGVATCELDDEDPGRRP